MMMIVVAEIVENKNNADQSKNNDSYKKDSYRK